jgi:hypothetical protein
MLGEYDYQRQKMEAERKRLARQFAGLANVEISDDNTITIKPRQPKIKLQQENEPIKDSLAFFKMFCEVRKQLCNESETKTYHLEEAIRKTFDKWFN